jgi:hypothetical protein
MARSRANKKGKTAAAEAGAAKAAAQVRRDALLRRLCRRLLWRCAPTTAAPSRALNAISQAAAFAAYGVTYVPVLSPAVEYVR